MLTESKMNGAIKASECKCRKCGKQAVAFWPCIDPDIASHPYCRKCLNKAKGKLLVELFRRLKTIQS